MIARRTFLQLAALPLLVRGARADQRKPVIWIGEDVLKGGTITAIRSGGRTVRAKLHKRVTPTSMDLLSTTNANTQFRLWVVFPKMPDQWMYLGLGGTWWRSESIGHDDTGSQTTFEIDRDTATRFAKAFSIPMHERAPLDTGLRTTWVMPPKASTRIGDPIAIILKIENAGTTTIGFAIGGRQRGPRDNRFAFKIARNTKAIAIKDAPDFGGKMYYKKLAPGEQTELTANLRDWADLTLPGHYAVDAVFEGELAKDGLMPTKAADQANVWDVSLTGRGGILVQ